MALMLENILTSEASEERDCESDLEMVRIRQPLV